MASLQAKVDAVKAAVASTSTCTTATIVTVKELLLTDTETASTASKAASRTARAPVTSRTKTNGATKTNNGRRGAARQAEEELSVNEKAALATHIINFTIKSLNEAAKPAPPSTPKKEACNDDLRKPAVARTLRRSLSAPLSPLQSRSMNRMERSPSLASKPISQPLTQSTGCLATVECARVAFACLRSIKEPVAASQADFQLENGMSTFVGKLTALGFQEQGWKELRILKRRLDAALATATSNSGKSTTAKASNTTQPMAVVLNFDDVIPDGCLSIITSFQIQVLRLIAVSKKPAQIEATLPFLLESHSSSPLVLLQRLVECNGKESEKAIRQLAALSQIILSLAPSVSTKEDHVATESRLSPTPQTSFELQVLCFKAQLRWWKLAGHEGVVDDEVYSPFSRCIQAFTRRHKAEDGPTYEIIASSFSKLMDLLQGQKSEPTKSSSSPLSTIYQLLGTAAHTERHYTEAQRWFQELKALLHPEQDSFVQIYSISARLLAAALKKTPVDSETEQLLQEVVEGLEGSLSGSVSELNQLLESLALARRSAVGVLVNKMSGGGSGESVWDSLFELVKTFVIRYPRFARRWLGAPPGRDASAKHILQFDQRRQVLMQSISQVLDSALMVVNIDVQSGKIAWQLMDDILQDCARLLISVEDPALSQSRAEQLGTYHVKISSLYFTRFTQLRKDIGKSKDVNKQILGALSRSIDMVKDRPLAQQEKAQLPTKLELFANLCKGAGRGNDAVRTLRSICTSMIEEGALLKVTAALASQSPAMAWTVDEKAETLSRTLRSIAKLDQSWNDWAFFLPEAERAAVLEHLMQISTGTSSKGQPLKIRDSCVEAVLRLYTLDRFPIRRLRVLLHLLFQNLGDANEMEEIRSQADDALQQVCKKALGEDGALAGYVLHLQVYHASISALATTELPFPASAMNETITSWRSMIESCKNKSDLYKRIDNPEGLLSYLQSAGQFASLRGENSLQLSILEILTTLSKALAEPTYNQIILNHTLLASQHLIIGHFSEAKKMLETTKELVNQAEGVSRGLVAGFHLSQAEYYAGIGSIDEAISSLSFAKEICDGPTASWAQSKSEATLALALTSFLDSAVALKQGHVQEALSCIKSSVKLLSYDWSKFEASLTPASNPSELGSSTNSISDLKEKSALNPVIGPRFWGLAFPLLRSLLHLSSVYAHLGMFQETIYYAESAQKIAENSGSSLYKSQVSAWIGSVYHRAVRLDKAEYFGNEAYGHLPTDICAARIQLACQLGDLYRGLGQDGMADTLLKMAEDTAKLLGRYEKPAPVAEEPEKPAPVVKGRSTATTRTSRTTRATRTKAACVAAPAPRTRKRMATVKTPAAPAKEVSSLPKDVYQASLMTSVIISRTLGFISQKDWTSALSTLELTKNLPKLFGTLSEEQVVTAISLIGHSMDQMIQDPVFSVVQDSTISFPAVSSSPDKGGSTKLSLTLTSPKKSRGTKASAVLSFADALRQAQELLLEAHASTLSTANSTMVHRISALLQSTVILLSATTTTKSKAVASSGFATFSVDLARNVTWRREQSTLEASKKKELDSVEALTTSFKRMSLGLTTEMTKFQKNYVELVPKNWSVISISLSDNRHDLCITKFQAGHSPFILRLPLERANSRDADSEVFNFEHGREEMMDIINLANETSHSASRDFSAKGARSAWWTEREELDDRLKDLLSTIETTWLGGFKGIFSQHERRPDLLARFQKSFQQTLDSSLPSRNRIRGKKTTKTPKITLDPRILDLFIGLGDPTDPDCEFDEALNDLLYFVVDILQFHGERNAYDEIDFDAMVVETYDALRGYYNAARGAERADDAHTVLVLDKALHAFPWESMPCMEGLAVSRVPSLACLRQLILESQKATKSGDDEDSPEGHYVSAERGTYILNPSTDLKNTQTTFHNPLKTLPSWTGIVNRAPQESEFEQALTSSDILLYFGHGSGAQYIRARTVRRLEKCRAATFLMGCSSAALTEAGEFECFGPVWNYMMAGCPAVVGTLWDVTDRDIDRFAGRSFEEWGLFPRGMFKEEKKGKGKARGVDEDEEMDDVTRNVSLAEAVARAREACRFKYLNAAAVVLYGIPVYINRGE
ncbi:Fc.00g077020.m01.CDS01 [Cosmosporella sp. VM-42]